MPIGIIPHELKSLVEHGWEWGSFEDMDQGSASTELVAEQSARRINLNWDWDLARALETEPATRRPRAFNRVFRAMIKALADRPVHCEVAYAMDKTQKFFDIKYVKVPPDAVDARKFYDALGEYRALPFEEQLQWQTHVQATYPNMREIVATMQTAYTNLKSHLSGNRRGDEEGNGRAGE